MSLLKIQYSLIGQQFHFEHIFESQEYCDLELGIYEPGVTISFNTLSFGYTIKKLASSSDDNETIISEMIYPPEGVTYLETDQQVIDTTRINWQSDWTISISAWIINNGTKIEGEYLIEVSRPESPNPALLMWEDNRYVLIDLEPALNKTPINNINEE